MNRISWGMLSSVLLAAVLAAPLAGQAGARTNRRVMVQTVEQAFLDQVTREMGLTEEQVPRFQRVVKLWAQKRAGLEAEERQARQGLNLQLRPGVAANPDSVGRFVDLLNANQVTYAESYRDEMRDLTPVLNPVQRGIFQIARDRLLQRVKEIKQQRAGALRGAATQEP